MVRSLSVSNCLSSGVMTFSWRICCVAESLKNCQAWMMSTQRVTLSTVMMTLKNFCISSKNLLTVHAGSFSAMNREL